MQHLCIAYAMHFVWSANGDNRELKITIKNGGGTDGDKYLGKAFMDGLKSAFKYGGDNKNLYIYYKERIFF